MRITHELVMLISRDESGNDIHFQRKETISRIQIDTYLKQHGGAFDVADTATLTLSMGDVAAVKGVYLEVDADCDVFLSGSADPIQLRKAPAASGGTAPAYAKLFLECDITQIDVEASQSSAVNGWYVVWGDVAP